MADRIAHAKSRSTSARSTNHFPSAATILLICSVLAGCGVTRGQLEAAATFGKSATKLADGVTSAYAQAAQDEADLRIAKYVVLSNLSKPKFDPTPITDGKYKPPLIRLGPKDIAGRYAAAAALTAYGEALTTLLDAKSQEGDLATATGKLTASLKGIPAQTLAQAAITTAEIDNIGKLITAFGDLYLDYRRREVLELVVPKANPIVTKICNLFGRDFDSEGGMFATIYFTDLDKVIDSTEDSLKENANNLQDRAVLLPIYQRTTSVKARVSTSYGSLVDAAKSCAKTSAAFSAAVKDPTLSLDDIIDFATKAQAAYNVVKATIVQK